MDWLAETCDAWRDTLLWLGVLTVGFGALCWLMPCNRGMFWWKDLRSAGTDLLYWFLAPVFARIGRTVLLVGGIALFFAGAAPGFAVIRALPLGVQCVAILLLQDVILYGMHRIFHRRIGWRFHAIHHSPTTLDWMAASRSHVVNQMFTFVLADVMVLLLGFSATALFVLVPFNVIYSTMVHANLNWTFGPLRYVFASPVFHRWHHTLEAEGLDKNFASTFPVLDLLFGTFHMPAGKLPEHFGTGEADFPEDFWGQLVYPFARATRSATAVAAPPAVNVEENADGRHVNYADNRRRRQRRQEAAQAQG